MKLPSWKLTIFLAISIAALIASGKQLCILIGFQAEPLNHLWTAFFSIIIFRAILGAAPKNLGKQ